MVSERQADDTVRATLSPDLQQFVAELFDHGLYVLPCGGGALSEPLLALSSLEPLYGREELCRLSLELLLDVPRELARPVEVLKVATGLLYHVGDVAALERLKAALTRPLCKANHHLIQTAVAGLCSRFGLHLPEGVTPLDEQEMYYLFGVL
jgi:hypothetical protein